jgi:hypothetical protein
MNSIWFFCYLLWMTFNLIILSMNLSWEYSIMLLLSSCDSWSLSLHKYIPESVGLKFSKLNEPFKSIVNRFEGSLELSLNHFIWLVSICFRMFFVLEKSNALHGSFNEFDDEAYIDESSTCLGSTISSFTTEDTVFFIVLLHVQ